MKNFLWAICLFITTTASAAEINFLENPTWTSVLEKAKKENKMIFLDGYATWCGPCKNMDAETYKNQDVADFYNANFINVKYDMEKGEGPMLAERYLVTAYPNLVFIDPEGVMVHKGIGFIEAADFVGLGKAAKDPATQYYTLKKKALELSNVAFLKFAELAASFEDEDLDFITDSYLEKQADILGNKALIDLVMLHIVTLPNEKALAYVVANKAKIVATKDYTAVDVEDRLVNLTLAYAISEKVQTNQDKLDSESVKRLLDRYVPERAFFVYNYFKVQFAFEEKNVDEAITQFDVLLANTPGKVSLDQICNAMMNVGPVLAENGKLAPTMAKFEAIKIAPADAENAFMIDFVKAVIYVKIKDYAKFKTIANSLIASKTTPESIKTDLKAALEKFEKL